MINIPHSFYRTCSDLLNSFCMFHHWLKDWPHPHISQSKWKFLQFRGCFWKMSIASSISQKRTGIGTEKPLIMTAHRSQKNITSKLNYRSITKFVLTNLKYYELRDALTSMEESVRMISFELSAFGWLGLLNFILTCRGLLKMRSLKSLFDFNKKWMHESLPLLSVLSWFKISTILAAYFSWLSSPISGFLLSFRYNTAQIITCAIIRKDKS